MGTYVKNGDEPGIYFMTEWVPNRLAAFLGPRTFGLPYRLGELAYHHNHEAGELHGDVWAGCGKDGQDTPHLAYRATLNPGMDYKTMRSRYVRCLSDRAIHRLHIPFRETLFLSSLAPYMEPDTCGTCAGRRVVADGDDRARPIRRRPLHAWSAGCVDGEASSGVNFSWNSQMLLYDLDRFTILRD
ncbi:MAG: hypothetical protein ACI8T1_004177 [Verrucomicrobiales bacterium]